MSRYTRDSVDRVREAVDIVTLISSRVDLQRKGVDSWFGCCPFHDEHTPSFHVRPDEKHYYCFGCSESGDAFDFVMQTEGLDFARALESLADRFGVTLQTEEEDPAAAAARARRERLYALLGRAATYYARQLWFDGARAEALAARRYLLDRGFTEEILREFRVGFAPPGWDTLLLASRRAGFSEEELLVTGVVQRSRRDPGKLLDRFRGRVMFPTADVLGRVRGFGARALSPEDQPKYLNTSEGDVYHKREVLYGIDLARRAAAKAGRMVLVEGYTDVLALHQAGVRNAVGIMGTSLTREQVAELVRIVGTLELCLDADPAGQGAMVRAAQLAAQLCADQRLELRVVPLPPGADPGELLAREGPDALRDRVASSVPYVVFEVDRILAGADLGSAEGKDRALAALRPALASLGQSVLRDELLRRVAGALELTDARLVTLLEAGARNGRAAGGNATARGPGPAAPRATPPAGLDPVLMRERAFLAMCVAAPGPGAAALAQVEPDELLSSEVLRRAARHLVGRLAAPMSELPRDDDELARAIADLVDRAGRGGPISADSLEHSRLLLERARLERRIARARAQETAAIPALAREREQVLEALAAVGGRLERTH